MYKQVIVVIGKMSKGKTATQVAHASVSSYKLSSSTARKRWENEGQKKVVLKAKGKEELQFLQKKCKKLGLPCFLIADAGLTELEPGTITALGIGPEKEDKINKVTGSLPLLR